jgi:hypothetical protein
VYYITPLPGSKGQFSFLAGPEGGNKGKGVREPSERRTIRAAWRESLCDGFYVMAKAMARKATESAAGSIRHGG